LIIYEYIESVMPPKEGDVPPDREPPWRITRIGRQSAWRGGDGECTVCGAGIDLSVPHHYVELSTRPSSVGRRERLVFCTRQCRDRWAGDG
jgi:hypothetical protein